MSLSTPHHNSEDGPYLADNASFAHAKSSDELGDLFAVATPILQKINTTNLSTVLGELSQASQGGGPAISPIPVDISAGTKLVGLLNSTLNAHADRAGLSLPASARPWLPVRRSDQQCLGYRVSAGTRLQQRRGRLRSCRRRLIPFSNHLASILTTYHPDIATILTAGDNVSRVLLAQQDNIGQVVQGAYEYFTKIAEGAAGLNKLPDGSTYVYFNTFVLFSDVNSLVCNLIAPNASGLSFLQPIQQALTGSGTAFNCASELASFDDIQNSKVPGLNSSPSGATTAASASGQAAATQAYGIVGKPDTSRKSSIGAFIDGLLGIK